MRIRWLLAIFALGLAGAVNAAELVVIASSEPTLEVGAVIDGSRPLKIPAGARVTLISSTGRTVVLEGPYDGMPDPTRAPADGDLVESLSRLITQESGSSTALAVFRGANVKKPENRPDLWGIDIARAGRYCLRRDIPAYLWWNNARAGAVVSLDRASSDDGGVRIRWPSAKRQLLWPESLMLADGAVYVARFRSGDEGERLAVRFMPTLASDAHRVAWMANYGCTGQALKVLNAIAAGEL